MAPIKTRIPLEGSGTPAAKSSKVSCGFSFGGLNVYPAHVAATLGSEGSITTRRIPPEETWLLTYVSAAPVNVNM